MANSLFLRVERLSNELPEYFLEAFLARSKCAIMNSTSVETARKVLNSIERMSSGGNIQQQKQRKQIFHENPRLAIEYLEILCQCHKETEDYRRVKIYAKRLLHLGLKTDSEPTQAHALAMLFFAYIKFENWFVFEVLKKSFFLEF